MPMFMDVHDGLLDATAEDVRLAHQRDLEVQNKYGVRYLTYWFNDPSGKVFCLVEAPDQGAAVACHKEAHGLIPSHMIEVEAPSVGQFLGNWQQHAPNQAFLDSPDPEPDPGLRAIMFTDLEGSTDVSTRMGDDAAMSLVRTHNTIVRECLVGEAGREVKHTGDGILASFSSVTRAVECAMAIQRRFAEQPDDGHPTRVRIGMSAGEPVTENQDLFGASVNLAARICAHAAPDHILVSSSIRDLAIGKPYRFVDQGPIALKGFDEPIRLYEVGWTG